MKKEIESAEDVQQMVTSFYDKVLKDEMLSPFFVHAIQHNWQHHLEIMNDFWNNVLFFTGGYTGNPLQTHKKMHEATPIKPAHFKQWLFLFIKTVDELFVGDKAALAKQRAQSIATVMQIKIIEANNNDLIY